MLGVRRTPRHPGFSRSRDEQRAYERVAGVRYRSVLSERFESMSSAGGGWEPLDGAVVDRLWPAEVVARWFANPHDGYGSYAMHPTSAVGRATAVTPPPVPQWVPPDELRWVRPGAPVRTELEVSRDRALWTWRGEYVIAPADARPEPPGIYRMEVVVLRAEHLAVLTVFRCEPLGPPTRRA